MATKIRLQRHGKKKNAFYHIVAADARAKRDGRFIEKLGTYNPNTNPATIELDFDRALHWIQTGATPTDTVKALLSYKGVLLKNHLDKGVAKGALTEAQATKKFEDWMADKGAKITGKTENVAKEVESAKSASLAAETATNEARAAEIAAKNAPEVVEEEVVEEAPEAEAETPTEEAPATEAETPAEEAPAAEAKTEATEEVVKEEAKKEEK